MSSTNLLPPMLSSSNCKLTVWNCRPAPRSEDIIVFQHLFLGADLSLEEGLGFPCKDGKYKRSLMKVLIRTEASRLRACVRLSCDRKWSRISSEIFLKKGRELGFDGNHKKRWRG